MEILSILKELVEPHILPAHRYEAKEAINLGISALKTIEDGNYQLKNHLNAAYGKMCYKDTDSAGKIDLKTLYEQVTMYCVLVGTEIIGKNKMEIFQQTDTPIFIFAHWQCSDTQDKLYYISFGIKEN